MACYCFFSVMIWLYCFVPSLSRRSLYNRMKVGVSVSVSFGIGFGTWSLWSRSVRSDVCLLQTRSCTSIRQGSGLGTGLQVGFMVGFVFDGVGVGVGDLRLIFSRY